MNMPILPRSDDGSVNYSELVNRLSQTWPARMAQAAWGGLTLPGDVYQGKVSMWGEDGRTNPEAINRAADLAGVVTSGTLAAPPVNGGAGMGIRAYHGSPYDFGKFDLAKIGTGEGAQAYGHGLYFAEKEGVAKGYRDTLSADLTDPANRLLKKHGGDIESAIAAARTEIDRLRNLPNAGNDPVRRDRLVATQEGNLRMLNQLKTEGEMKPGRMYEVNINADPAHFLDWDKPLSEQSANVQSALKNVGIEGKLPEYYHDMPLQNGARLQVWDDPDFGRKYAMVMPNGGGRFMLTRTEVENLSGAAGQEYTGKGVVSKLSGEGGSATSATDQLRQAGIPGIKYLDQGSRSAGEGTSNYVVFDPSIIEILRKYGLAGAAALPAVDYISNARSDKMGK